MLHPLSVWYALLTVLFTVLVTLLIRKFIAMSEEFDDYRQIALETQLRRVPFWVERWGRWVTLHELTGKQRADLLEKCTEMEGKKAKVRMDRLYPMLVILSAHYPDTDNPPVSTHPHYHKYPGVNGIGPHPKSGQPIFTMRDIFALNETPGGILELLNKPAAELSGLREEDIEEKKDTSDPTVVESDAFIIE